MENVDGAGASTSNENVTTECGTEFFNTGRVGRRNAMPDILGSHATTSTAELPDQLSALTTSEMAKPTTSTSSSNTSTEMQTTSSTSQMTTTSDS